MAGCRQEVSWSAVPHEHRPQSLTHLIIEFKRALSAISEIPESLLRAELLRRDVARSSDSVDPPSCGSGDRGAYNTPLHVMALFLILGLSTFGMCRFLCLPEPNGGG